MEPLEILVILIPLTSLSLSLFLIPLLFLIFCYMNHFMYHFLLLISDLQFQLLRR